MFFELSELYLWSSRDGVDEHFPANVQQMFHSKRGILDATEVPIERPKHRNAQRVTFSNTHTLKTMIGGAAKCLTSMPVAEVQTKCCENNSRRKDYCLWQNIQHSEENLNKQ